MKALIYIVGLAFVMNAFSFKEEYRTDWYTKDNPGNADEILCLLDKIEDGGAVVVHEGRIRKRGYYIASPLRSERGMSFYELTLLSKVEGEWERMGSTLYMCNVVDKELKHSDERFIRVEEVSLGVVFAIVQSWEKMYSAKNFERLVSAEFVPEEQEKEKKARFIGDLNNEGTRLKIDVVDLILGRHGYPLYSIEVQGEERRWSIECDIVDGEVIYLYISEAHL